MLFGRHIDVLCLVVKSGCPISYSRMRLLTSNLGLLFHSAPTCHRSQAEQNPVLTEV